MLQAYEAVIDNGKINWLDTPPNLDNQKVAVIILPTQSTQPSPKQRKIGSLAGKATFPDDINKYDDEVAQLFGVE